MSASIIDLQSMLSVCDEIGHDIDIKFNSAKCKCIAIGPRTFSMLGPVSLNNVELQWVSYIKYLGIRIAAGKVFKIDLSDTRRKFFASVNSILSKCNYTSDMVKLKLMESHCLPILLYAIESLNMSIGDIKL